MHVIFLVVHPRITQPVPDRNRPEGPPNRAITLKTRPESNLPNPVTPPDPALGLRVRQLVPQRTARRVAEPVQGHPRRLHVPLSELKILLQLVQDGASTRVYAEVLERELEVRNVRFDLRLENLLPNQRYEKQHLFGKRQDEWAQRRYVRFQRVARHGHELTRKRNADGPFVVFSLVNTLVVPVVSALVGPDIQGYVFGADDDGVGVGICFEEVLGEVDGDQTGAAAHAAQWLTIMDDSDGVGLNRLQFTMRMSIWFGLIPVFLKSESRAPNMTDSASDRACSMDSCGGLEVIPRGKYVSSPRPDRFEMRVWKLTVSGANAPFSSVIFRNDSTDILRSSSGL
ncbi:hypothetical protein DVH24_011963 [Malus domestica]|uniref:Uncharacterized protein n=1 Tax=Malus domestica TaxID=3750 RepID=A0A498JAU6_MALDO|nr:hypothetical protein DVH24_011963 [Malus domestica]